MMPVYYTREQKRQRAIKRGILVDPQDEWLLEEYTWYLRWDGYNTYAVTSLPRDERGNKQLVALHHMILGQPIWEGVEIDHINHNAADNRRDNLRYATRSQNRINAERASDRTGMRNIDINRGGYRVRFRRDNQEHYVGTFATLSEAMAARDEWSPLEGVAVDE
jgi:HNH endonuclease